MTLHMDIPLAQQATAVERAALNLEGHTRNLRDLVARGRRPLHDLEIAEAWLPDLKAAAITMRQLTALPSGEPAP